MRTLLVCLLALVACSGPPTPGRQIWITMPEVGRNRFLPLRNSAYGENLSPLMAWGYDPDAKSYLLLLEDPDAPGPRPFVHWLIWNIPGGYSGLAEGVPATIHPASVPEAVQGRNDAGGVGYFGPKPPSGLHHYTLRLIALDTVLSLPADADVQAVMAAARRHQVGHAERMLLYAGPSTP